MKNIEDSVELLRSRIKNLPQLAIMLGSGWDKVVKECQIEAEIGYEDLFGANTSVPGHMGKLIIGSLAGVEVVLMSGRFHTYENYSAAEVVSPIRAMAELGLKKLIVTSASGAINELYRVGDFVILSDLLTLFLPKDPVEGAIFTDMSEVFDRAGREKAINVCATKGIPFHEGIYAFMHGPHFETPADKMALKFLGADVVGMSTVPETIAARSLGIKVLGLSYVTNLAFVKHAHEDVIAAAREGSGRMVSLLKELIVW